MTDPRHVELLKNIGLFESLTEDDIESLSNRLEDSEYDEGAVVFSQGDQGESLFIVEEGAVEISFGEGRTRVALM